MTEPLKAQIQGRFDDLLAAADGHYKEIAARPQGADRDAALTKVTELIEILESATHDRVRRVVGS